MTKESDQSGVLETYTYDSNARLLTVKDGSGNLLVTYTYDDMGRVSTESFGNGTKTIYAYDANGDVASITNLAADGTVQSSLTYTYNADGDPLTCTDQAGNVTSYAYDQSGQLTQVTLPGGRTISYSYDADGNRTSVVDSAGTLTASYTVNDLDPYTAVGSTTYTYNKNGDLATMTDAAGTTTYTYNPAGQLAGSIGPGGTFTYSYNAVGQLDSYTTNGTQTNLLLDASGRVIAAYNASGQLIANYRYGLQLLSEQLAGASSSFYDFDLTGNTTAIINASGDVVSTYSYLPFGEKLASSGPAGNLFTYSGQSGVLDLGDGLYQMTHRTYSPSLGRFIEPDPIGYAGRDINIYRYAANNPVTYTDPSGLFLPFLVVAVEGAEVVVVGLATVGEVGEATAATGGAIELGGYGSKVFPFVWDLAEEISPEAARMAQGLVNNFGGAVQAVVTPIITLVVNGEAFGETPDPWDDYLNWVIKFKYRMGLYNSTDPNEIVGPGGAGPNQDVTAEGPLSYTVFFENEPTATGPAQDVTVSSTLSPNVDLATFELLGIGWGSEVLDVPPGLTSYSTRVSYVQPNTGKTILVDASAALNFSTRTLTWTFATLDPTTLDTPSDALAGFLPPDNSSGQGTGYVSYAVDPVAGLASGTVISAAASVVFDENAAISTATWTNTIDAGPPPTSTVTALPATTNTPSFTVAWSGSDSAGPGVSAYDIYVSDDGGAYSLWQDETTATSATYTGQVGHTYQFYSVASNDLGLTQPAPMSAQATITLDPPLVTMTGVQEVLNKKHQVKEVIITFSAAVDSAEAGKNGIYRLATAGKHGSYTAKNAGLIKLKKAAYSTADDTVTLTPKKPFALTKSVQLVVNGTPPSGLQDTLGRFLDGGTKAVAILTKGKATIDAVAKSPADALITMKHAAVDAVLEREDTVASKHPTSRARSIRA